jgi:hypothetical protein
MKISPKFIPIFILLTMNFFTAKNSILAEQPTFDAVIKGFTETKKLLFEETPELLLTCRLEIVEHLDPNDKEGHRRGEWLLMRKENMWRTEVRPLDAETMPDGYPLSMDPIIRIIKNGMGIEHTAYNTNVVVSPLAPLNVSTNMFREWGYFNRVGYGISEAIIISNKKNYKEFYDTAQTESTLDTLLHPDMPKYLEQNVDKYIFRDSETIDGRQCWVIEWPEHDKMWIDPECGWAIRKRVHWYQREKVREWELVNRDFKEIKPGLWLPMTQVETRFGYVSSHPKEKWDKPFYRNTYKVADLALEVPTERFNFSPPVGAFVTDFARNEQYTVSDPNADPFAGAIAQGLKVNRYAMFRAILIIVVSVLLLIGTWFLLRNK